ncbi:acyl-CoA Delta(11) desaturase-like isoform X2 [Cydia pomonella]|nr:acyl-CoA Delta(11) desaturase-like isoform X2 [Cydia pomonella]
MPTMVANVADLLKHLGLNIDGKVRVIPILSVIWTVISVVLYFYVYVFSILWYVFWRGTGDPVVDAVLLSLACACIIGLLKLFVLHFNRKSLQYTLISYLSYDKRLCRESRMYRRLVKNLRVIKRRASAIWILLVVNGAFYCFMPLLLPGRHLAEDMQVIYGMAPDTKENEPLVSEPKLAEPRAPAAPTPEPRKYTVRYFVVLKFVYWHLGALYGLYLAFSAHWATIVFNVFIYMAAGFGVTAGGHRLWSHRGYKATLPLQVLLVLMQTLACQLSVHNWARDHRLHHKYVDTDTDPYNARRGLFFSHIGWLLVDKHPEVLRRGKTIYLADLEQNPVVMFQKKYYYYLNTLLGFIMPVVVPVVWWGESWSHAHHVHLLFSLVGLHIYFSVNSFAHAGDRKPYDATITPAENNFLYVILFGEGHHNYHHAFPSDYRISEFGFKYFNYSTTLIELFAKIGWAYDLKPASPDIVAKRAHRTGDGSRQWPVPVENGFENCS